MVLFTNALESLLNDEDNDINDQEEYQEFLDLINEEEGSIFDVETEDEPSRKERWKHIRKEWRYHVAQLIHENCFKKEYRMSFDTWNKLYKILYFKLLRMKSKSRSLDYINVNLIIATGMRWLSGTPVLSVRHIFNFSRAEGYNTTNLFINSVLDSKELDINLPTTTNEWKVCKDGFHKKSKDGAMYGCCAAIDGFFVKTKRPDYWEDSNIRAYYSGHYEHYGLNCQAACDSNLKFIYFGVVAPGSTNDNVAFTRTGSLKKTIDDLNEGDYFVGDAAYTVTEHLLIPFTGPQRSAPAHDTFNFYLSQKRIRIEMAFGLLVSKFRILKSALTFRMKKNSQIIMACARLHNFILDNDVIQVTNDNEESYIDPNNLNIISDETIENIFESPNGMMTYTPTMREENFEVIEGISHLRRIFVEWLSESGYTRPNYNLLRNSRLRNMEQIQSEYNGINEVGYCDTFFHPE